MATSDSTQRAFETGERVNDDGLLVPAYGFTHDGMFITDPYMSECGRFVVSPDYYGLTDVDAQRLIQLNASAQL